MPFSRIADKEYFNAYLTRLSNLIESGSYDTLEQEALSVHQALNEIFGEPKGPDKIYHGEPIDYRILNEIFRRLYDDIAGMYTAIGQLYDYVNEGFNSVAIKYREVNRNFFIYQDLVNEATLANKLFYGSHIVKTDTFKGSVNYAGNLNIDQEAGVCTLGYDDSNVTVVVPKLIKIFQGSNGSIGNVSDPTRKVSDMASLVDNNPDTWVEYEKYTTYTVDKLILNLLIKFEEPVFLNYLNIDLMNLGGGLPEITFISQSIDGIDFDKIVDYTKDPQDYIRDETGFYFDPCKTSYVLIGIEQTNGYVPINYNLTRYAIGIRDIIFKQISYQSNGELISDVISAPSSISGISLLRDGIGKTDFNISYNEGTSWENVVPIEVDDSYVRKDLFDKVLDGVSESKNQVATVDKLSVREFNVKIQMEQEPGNPISKFKVLNTSLKDNTLTINDLNVNKDSILAHFTVPSEIVNNTIRIDLGSSSGGYQTIPLPSFFKSLTPLEWDYIENNGRFYIGNNYVETVPTFSYLSDAAIRIDKEANAITLGTSEFNLALGTDVQMYRTILRGMKTRAKSFDPSLGIALVFPKKIKTSFESGEKIRTKLPFPSNGIEDDTKLYSGPTKLSRILLSDFVKKSNTAIYISINDSDLEEDNGYRYEEIDFENQVEYIDPGETNPQKIFHDNSIILTNDAITAKSNIDGEKTRVFLPRLFIDGGEEFSALGVTFDLNDEPIIGLPGNIYEIAGELSSSTFIIESSSYSSFGGWNVSTGFSLANKHLFNDNCSLSFGTTNPSQVHVKGSYATEVVFYSLEWGPNKKSLTIHFSRAIFGINETDSERVLLEGFEDLEIDIKRAEYKIIPKSKYEFIKDSYGKLIDIENDYLQTGIASIEFAATNNGIDGFIDSGYIASATNTFTDDRLNGIVHGSILAEGAIAEYIENEVPFIDGYQEFKDEILGAFSIDDINNTIHLPLDIYIPRGTTGSLNFKRSQIFALFKPGIMIDPKTTDEINVSDKEGLQLTITDNLRKNYGIVSCTGCVKIDIPKEYYTPVLRSYDAVIIPINYNTLEHISSDESASPCEAPLPKITGAYLELTTNNTLINLIMSGNYLNSITEGSVKIYLKTLSPNYRIGLEGPISVSTLISELNSWQGTFYFSAESGTTITGAYIEYVDGCDNSQSHKDITIPQ